MTQPSLYAIQNRGEKFLRPCSAYAYESLRMAMQDTSLTADFLEKMAFRTVRIECPSEQDRFDLKMSSVQIANENDRIGFAVPSLSEYLLKWPNDLIVASDSTLTDDERRIGWDREMNVPIIERTFYIWLSDMLQQEDTVVAKYAPGAETIFFYRENSCISWTRRYHYATWHIVLAAYQRKFQVPNLHISLNLV